MNFQMNRSSVPAEDPQLSAELQALYAAYRDSLPDPEVSPAFMPRLWAGIEARRSVTLSFGRITRRFVTAAGGLCLAMSLFLLAPSPLRLNQIASTYVDVLANESPDDVTAVDVSSGDNL